MGEDLQRFVNDEPIKARRVGPLERLGRWCRRNPTVASLTAAVLVLMAVGTAVSTWQAVVATRAQADLAAKNAGVTAFSPGMPTRWKNAAGARLPKQSPKRGHPSRQQRRHQRGCRKLPGPCSLTGIKHHGTVGHFNPRP